MEMDTRSTEMGLSTGYVYLPYVYVIIVTDHWIRRTVKVVTAALLSLHL